MVLFILIDRFVFIYLIITIEIKQLGFINNLYIWHCVPCMRLQLHIYMFTLRWSCVQAVHWG